ncbi:MAG: hypothetical protein FD173_951 [Gallionellaceae bacterium]|nr:MAG: hypothetical protein FD173_951 [Gallionellaceae bacterium]
MARKAEKPVVVEEPAINHDAIQEDMKKVNELAVMNAETLEKAGDLATSIGYEGALTVGALEDEIRFYQRQTAEACFELGKRLLVLKELTPHGEFKTRLELLGIEYRSAARFMAVSKKFANVTTSPLLKVVETQSKLLELLVLDDEEVEALGGGETVRGIGLDDIETMSVRELKAKLREAKADAEATDRVLSDNQKTITKLQKAVSKKIDPNDMWSEAMRLLSAQTVAHKTSIVEYTTALDVIRERVMEQEAEPGHEAALEAARSAIGKELWDAITRSEEQIVAVRLKFEKTLGALIGA